MTFRPPLLKQFSCPPNGTGAIVGSVSSENLPDLFQNFDTRVEQHGIAPEGACFNSAHHGLPMSIRQNHGHMRYRARFPEQCSATDRGHDVMDAG
jgi:hypothetical protein